MTMPSSVRGSLTKALTPRGSTRVKSKQVNAPVVPLLRAVELKEGSCVDSSDELTEIHQSVERLKQQRLHVAHMQEENVRLDLELMMERQENQSLRTELVRLKSAEHSRETLQATLTTLEAQYQKLEISHREARMALREAQNERGEFEMRWQDANKAFQRLENETMKTLERKLAAVEGELRAQKVKRRQEHEKWEESRRIAAASNSKLKAQVDELEHALSTIDKQQTGNFLQWQVDKKRLEEDLLDSSKKVDTLLATTDRQTTLLEDCERVISELKKRVKESRKQKIIHSQIQVSLERQVAELEERLKEIQRDASDERQHWTHSKDIMEKEGREQQTRIFELEQMLMEQEKILQAQQTDLVERERRQFHLDQANKYLAKEKDKIQSLMVEMEVALRDETDERRMYAEKARSLREQLDAERQNRAHWASSRSKLLAAFCEEENKLSASISLLGK